MGLIISSKEEINNYFENKALGQSSLKKLSSGIESFLASPNEDKAMFYEEKGHFIIGSGVDTLLTGTEEQFDAEYYVSELDQKPSDAMMSMASHVMSMIMEQLEEEETLESFLGDNGDSLGDYPELMDTAREYQNYNSKLLLNTFHTKMVTEADLYFKDICKSFGKQLLDQKQNFLIKDIVTSLRNHPRTADFFNRHKQEKDQLVDIYLQLPIYFTYKGVRCKALLDMVYVVKNEQGKILFIQPIDLKTMSGFTRMFSSSVKTRRYDIQGAWYTLALEHYFIEPAMDGEPTSPIVIKPFMFIVESTTDVGSPLVFETMPSLMHMGKFGRPKFEMAARAENPELTSYLLQWEIKGYEQLLDEFIWYEANGWEESKEVVGKSFLTLDWNGLVE